MLNFLRDSWVPLPPTIHERQQLYQEAQFYMLEVSSLRGPLLAYTLVYPAGNRRTKWVSLMPIVLGYRAWQCW